MNQPRNIIIDCDTGVDDALAILLALRSPEFHVLGITCVAGNVGLDKVVRNTLVVVEHSGVSVPVYEGSYRPLLGAGKTAEYVHGMDGLGDIGFPEPRIQKNPEHAVDYLVRTFIDSKEPIDLITTAPLTNIALALQKDRRLENKINSLVMMAGAADSGNTTPAAEFNVYADPEAADVVFKSNIPNKVMIGLDPIRRAGLYAVDVEKLEKSTHPWCQMAAKILRSNLVRSKKATGQDLPTTPPDLAALAVALDPTLGTGEMLNVNVETAGTLTRGMTVVDRRPFRGVYRPAPEPNMKVIWTIDEDRYRKLVLDTMLK
ncbi:MAG: nucleoside hydrolase [Chloroflexota bacterium]